MSEVRIRAAQRGRAAVSAAAAAIVFVVGGAGCSGGSGSGNTAGSTAPIPSLTIRWNGDPTTLDLQRYQGAGNALIEAAYDRLVAVGPTGNLVPYLATSWTITPTSVTFKLRTDATCSDGAKVTPQVVAQSFQRLITVPKLNSQMAANFGPGPYQASANPEQVTFTFTTATPYRNLVYGFTLPLASIVCPAGLKAAETDQNAMLNLAFGSGPYTLVSFTHANQLVFQKRTGWGWGPTGSTPPSQLPDKITYQEIGNDTTAANLLSTGGLDIAKILGPDVARLAADKGLTHLTRQAYATEPLIFNQRPGRITTDPKVRQALMTAVDPAAWNQAAFGGRGTVFPGLLPKGVGCYDPGLAKFMPKPSVNDARQIMISNGYALSGATLMKEGKPARVRVALDASTLGASGEYLQTVYNQVGFQVDLAATDAAGFAQNSLAGNFDVAVLTLAEATNNPAPGSQQFAFTSGPVLPTGFNIGFTGAGDPEIASLLASGLQSTGTASCGFFSKLQQLYLERYYVLPLSSPITHWFTRGYTLIPSGSNLIDVTFIKRGK